MTDELPKKEKQTWLRRVLTHFRRATPGDLIAAEIGDQARGVVVGKNIIQIGSVKIPLWITALVLFAAIAGIAVVLYSAYRTDVIGDELQGVSDFVRTPTSTPPPRMPNGHFNIAVAEFSAPSDRDSLNTQARAQELSNSIASFLDNQEDALTEILRTQVSIWGPTRGIAPLSIGEEAERAKRLNAHVMLFGMLQLDSNERWYIQPKFFLTEESVGQAAELAGEHSLGTAVPFRPASIAGMRDANTVLRMRVDALIQILLGLSYMAYGDLDGYQKAAQVLQAAADESEWAKSADSSGQEVLFLFLGNAYLGQSFLNDEGVSVRRQLLARSQAAFVAALDQNSDYARAYNGLGSTYFQQARSVTPANECQWDWALLNEAERNFQTALSLPDDAKPASGQVDYRANFGMARVRFWQGYCDDPAQWTEADRLYQTVLAEYQQLQDPIPHLTDLAAYAHTDLGFMQFFQADLALQSDDYNEQTRGQTLLASSVAHYTKAMQFARQSGTGEGRSQQRAIMPYYLTVHCLSGDRTTAQQMLIDFVSRQEKPEETRSNILNLINQQVKEDCNL